VQEAQKLVQPADFIRCSKPPREFAQQIKLLLSGIAALGVLQFLKLC
jgi:hypothetical protein